jgi:UDP-3-O-[3-hydroxymyristoyl] glucosamine N-acyltransferase
MQITAKEIAQLLKGTVEGDPEASASRPSKIEEGGPGTISFLGNLKYEEHAYRSTASILLVSHDFEPRQPIAATLIRVANVYQAVAQLLERFGANHHQPATISELAFIHPEAQLGSEVSVGPFAVIEAQASLGTGCRVHAQAYIGPGARLGRNVVVHPGARILADCEVGNDCIINANAVLGSDGFGFTPQEDGTYRKVIHVGNVVLKDNVEIGANTTIDRGTMGSTTIHSGVKLDNLIQVGHNVEIGEHTVIAAQTGIAGSTKIGRGCRIGGQVGFVGHIHIADGTQVQAQSGVAGAVLETGQALFGSPAIGYREYIRSYAVFKQLPELYRKINELEKKLGAQDHPNSP